MNTSQISFVFSISSEIKRFGFSSDVCDFIGCQFALESSFGESMLAKVNHNLCGMKHPVNRPTLSVCSLNGFAVYDGVADSVFDYVYWLSWNRFSVQMSLDEFRNRLTAKGYCPESDYITKINYLLKSYQNVKQI